MERDTHGNGRVRVVVSTAVEMFARLYAHAHTVRGDFVPSPSRVPQPPEGFEREVDWFFGDDFSLGMNIAVLAAERGWNDAETARERVERLSPADLVAAMLRPPSCSANEMRRREHVVQRICKGEREGLTELVNQCTRDGFEAASVRRVLAAPTKAQEAFTSLIAAVASDFNTEEPALAATLAADAASISDAADWSRDRVTELSRATGGWTISDAAAYSILLVPSESIRPYLVSRVVSGSTAVVIFSTSRTIGRSAEEVADALKVLGHVQRLNILRNIATLPATGQDLAELLGLSEATVHHHTSALRGVGLILSEREGIRVYHRASKEALSDLLEELQRTVFGA